MQRLRLACLIVAVIGLGACANSEAPNANHPPEITAIESQYQSVAVTGTAALTCRARDPDDDAMSYYWSASGGTITGGGYRVTWTAPEQPGTFIIRVTVADDRLASTKGSVTISAHVNSLLRVLVHTWYWIYGGNVWWYPQTGPFTESAYHQGKALADYIRSLGFNVYEMRPKDYGTRNVDSLLNQYDRVIAIDGSDPAEYIPYDEFLKRKGTALIIVSDKSLGCSWSYPLTARCGISASGMTWPNTVFVTTFAKHQITTGVSPLEYQSGAAFIDPGSNPNLEVLGWLPDSTFLDCDGDHVRDENEMSGALPVMGVLHRPDGKLFFIGDQGIIFDVPQPLVDNLIHWAFF